MATKAPGRYAPDGSVYVTFVSATTKSAGLQSPDGAIYVTKAS